ncbi:MAG TPA: ATP synthase F1 subunit delta [Verrucomicrobiae bacterium]|nr:ATP synthase F1 subunit delta [Verrucomicrobiae bacterium]
MPTAVANRYANALADVVTAPGSALAPAAAVTELHSFAALLRSSAELHNALATPSIPASRKRAVINRLGDLLSLSKITRNFLYVLIDKRRIAILGEIVESFDLVVDERLGFARAQVTSAAELNEQQRAAVTDELQKLTGKRLRSRYDVDPALIGGLVARIGSTVYDGSIRGQLHTLGLRLTEEA